MRFAARRPDRYALLAMFAAALAGCGSPARTARHAAKPAGVVVRSNVARDDYTGAAVCAACHADIAAAWERSPMHRMTRDARGADVRAPFDGTRWRFKDDVVVLNRRQDDRFVRLELAAGGARTYRVTRVIGGRTREDFAGVDEDRGGEELVLPISYVLATGSLRYKGYSVMVHERASLRAGPAWSRTCIFCHNTVPEVDRILGAIAGPKARPYQSEQVDRWLPANRRARVRVTESDAFARAIAEETARLGQPVAVASEDSRVLAGRAIDVVRAAFDGAALIEVGIGCEACHGGAREHAADPRVRSSLVPVAPWLDVSLPVPTRAAAINRVCARCHQVLYSRYPFTWEGGKRDLGAGGSHINSGEARDFLLGGCAGAMSCTTCHDPHAADDPTTLRALATPSGNVKCTGCHHELADRARLRDHAHHDPDGSGGACISCHMPRKNMGLDGTLTRYHRIGSPTDSARVLGDRPLECALCHAERSVGSLVDAMEKWWPVRYPRQQLLELYGSLDANTMRATLARGKPHEQAVAIATLDEERARDAAPMIAQQLTSAYPLVREWARRALAAILGRCDVDLAADDAAIARQGALCAASSVSTPAAAPPADEDPED